MSRPELGDFVRAVTGDQQAALGLLGGYLDVLAGQVGAVLAAADDRGRAEVLTRLDRAERAAAGGSVAALAWPPVAGRLLGRTGPTPAPADLARVLAARGPVPVGADPAVVGAVRWLRGHGPGRPAPGAVAAGERALRPAWQLLDRWVPEVAGVVRTCTRAVTVRRTAQAGVTGSWSTDELIGCTVLVNVHQRPDPVALARPDPVWLAECLVHESVHHCQGMVEVSRPFVRDPALVTSDRRYVSPWTGAPLTAKSLLAACFVWYALASWWDRAVRSPARSADAAGAVDSGLRRAAHGFVAGDPAGAVRSFGWALDPEVTDLVAELQAGARERWDMAPPMTGAAARGT